MIANRRPGLGLCLILASSFCFGASGAIAKAIMQSSAGQISAMQLTQVRITGAAILLLLVLAVLKATGHGSLNTGRDRWRARDLRLVIIYGLTCFLAIQLLYYIAIQRMAIGVVLLIEYLAPVLVIGWAVVVQRRKQAPTTWAGVGCALAGLAIIVQPWLGFSLDIWGALAALGAAVALACYFLIAESGASRISPVELATYGATVGALALAVISPPWHLPFQVFAAKAQFAGGLWPIWLLALLVVVMGTVLAYLLGIASLGYLAAPVVSVLATLEVLFASAAAWLLIDEKLSTAEVIGGAVLLLGAILAQASRTPRPVAEDFVQT